MGKVEMEVEMGRGHRSLETVVEEREGGNIPFSPPAQRACGWRAADF